MYCNILQQKSKIDQIVNDLRGSFNITGALA